MRHREPPFPPSFNAKRQDGICCWCGEQIVNEPRRRWWHARCSNEYLVISSNASALDALIERDGNRCAICGRNDLRLEVDHIVALQSAPRELRFWTLANLQLLCSVCHRLKTTIDNREARQSKSDPPKLAPVDDAGLYPLTEKDLA